MAVKLITHRYLGPHSASGGIKLGKASGGNLQAYIDSGVPIANSLRWKWSLQAVEAVVYVHQKGVIHSDLRPENYLVHATDKGSLDLWLCDFGGAKCDDLGLNISHLPDDPFFDPRMPWNSTAAVDIFSLGSIIYTILTGHWPYREGPSLVTVEDKNAYETYVNEMFTAGSFPDVSSLKFGTVVMGCWDHQYSTAEEVLLQLIALVH